MPVAVAFDKDERIYVQAETTFGQIPNTGGTATVSGANAMRHISCSLDPAETMIVREDKTGDRTMTPGQVGRYGGAWSIDASMVLNGTAGVASDQATLITAAFQNAGAVKTGTAAVASCVTGSSYSVTTAAPHAFVSGNVVWVPASASNAPFGAFLISVTSTTVFVLLGANSAVAITVATSISRSNIEYTLADQPTKSFDLWRFRTPSTLRQEVGIGCVVSSVKWAGGEDAAAKVSYGGPAKWITDSLSFAHGICDVDQQAGLTAFPAEPASPVTNGGIIPAFMGYLVFNGSALVKLRSWGITHSTGVGLPQEYIGTRYGQTPEADARDTSVDFVIDDDDNNATQLLYEAAQAATVLDGIFVQGNISAGNTAIWYCRGIQLPIPKTGSTGRKFTRSYSGCKAHGSGIATLDEIKLIHA